MSGGETFLASLALALVEEIPLLSANKGAVMVESMFLDEGFGALDMESLDLAAQALEVLRGKGRFPYTIYVIKEPGGSRVELPA